ncbi:hypothetical protein, partial [Burkholderia multivorans]|uniref:hypothetical protein n=1 Tax=Burkholderia multivorans TaxID=87883 RepID=UPI0019553EBF
NLRNFSRISAAFMACGDSLLRRLQTPAAVADARRHGSETIDYTGLNAIPGKAARRSGRPHGATGDADSP